MNTMPRPRLPYVRKEISRHGKTVWYFRRGDGPRLRLPAEYGSEEFIAAYQKALSGAVKPKKPGKETIRWLVDRYRESASWTAGLALGTRNARGAILRAVVAKIGDEPFASIDKASIVASVDSRAQTPFAAKNFLKTMRGLFAWAVMAKHVAVDPTEGVSIKVKESDGFETWTDEDIAQFKAKWPLGTRERVMFAVFLGTGLRRGDACRFGRQHIKAGLATIVSEKTQTPVYVPVLPELQEAIDAGPVGDLVFITGQGGGPLTKESLGNYFREACDAAGVKKSAHGLRKAAAVRLAEAGATVDELEAIFGWEGGKMASHYTKAANRKRLATAGMARLTGANPEQKTAAPSEKVRRSDGIT
ncbi:integrase [Rhodoblastus acidophilus]|uniref:tyrosine-type recombinase/integrase n=1 Tax=Rhodoblastus acidophilus TaxID=1074 RepID=UPI00222576F7|nr:site-specific integrase [Rhodoblastus acidophilus]MCW2315272.1 integrase [Rhodoblastus acidophilus]